MPSVLIITEGQGREDGMREGEESNEAVCQKSTGLDPSAGFFQVPQSNLDLNYIKETKTVLPEKTTCNSAPTLLKSKAVLKSLMMTGNPWAVCPSPQTLRS